MACRKGPSLTGYGLQLGATGHLTPEQITHMVAYLIDPASPVSIK